MELKKKINGLSLIRGFSNLNKSSLRLKRNTRNRAFHFMADNTSPRPMNRKVLVAFICSVIAILAFCIGLFPIPFTAIPCYPLGTLFGIASLVLGMKAQREIRANGESGKALALISIYTGVFTILAMVCFITAGVILLPRVIEWLSQITPQPSP